METTSQAISWLQILPPIITAIGVFVAAAGIFINTSSTRKRATIDLIMKERGDSDLVASIKAVNDLAKTDNCVMSNYLNDEKNRIHIIHVLNQREFVSTGIHSKAFHGGIYKDFEYSMFMRDWRNLEGFIKELRKQRNSKTAFQEFEKLAKKMGKE